MKMAWRILAALLAVVFLTGCATENASVSGIAETTIFPDIIFPENSRLYIQNVDVEYNSVEFVMCAAAWSPNDPHKPVVLPNPNEYSRQYQGQFLNILEVMLASGNWALSSGTLNTSSVWGEFGEYYHLNPQGALAETYADVNIEIPRYTYCANTPGLGEIWYRVDFWNLPEVLPTAGPSVAQGWDLTWLPPGITYELVLDYLPRLEKPASMQGVLTGPSLDEKISFCALAWTLNDPLWPQVLPQSLEEYAENEIGQFSYIMQPMLTDSRWQLIGPPEALAGKPSPGATNWYEFLPVDPWLASQIKRLVIGIQRYSDCSSTPGVGGIALEIYPVVPPKW